jgi:hypothetical protein
VPVIAAAAARGDRYGDREQRDAKGSGHTVIMALFTALTQFLERRLVRRGVLR